MGNKVSKPTHIFVYNMSVVLNTTNPVRILINKAVAISYHFVREHVDNNIVEVRKIHTRETF